MADFIVAMTLICLASDAPRNGLHGLWKRKLLFFGAFSAIFPDVINYFIRQAGIQTGLLNDFFRFHEWMHSNSRPGVSYGGPIQIVVMILACALLWELYKTSDE